MSANERELLRQYANVIENKLGYISRLIENKILNIGVRIGMELQEAFMGEEQ